MKTSETIYQLLIQEKDYLSGETIAEQLHISRTAVWKAIKSLQASGVQIDSAKHKGYRLTSGDIIIPEQLENNLGISVTYQKSCQSTQTEAKLGIQNKDNVPHLYISDHQEKGKGRYDRDFYSPQGGIYMSLRLTPNVPFQEIKPYTLLIASATVKAISQLTGIETDIKWVNDIYFNGKKIGGILTEALTSIETGLVTDMIIGIGLNFSNVVFPKAIENKAASLYNQNPTITRQDLISRIWSLFFETPEKDLLKVYKDKSLVLDKQVTFEENHQFFKGIAKEITDQGHLIVKLDNGETKKLRSGEISLSSWS